MSRPVSRVLSRTIIPLESPSPATSSGLPGSTRGHALPLSRRLPYLALLQVGFAVPPGVTTGAVRSYRTVSPLPVSLLKLRRFAFCCTFRRLTPPRCYLAPRPQGARTFLHISREMQRPSSRLGADHSGMGHAIQGENARYRYLRAPSPASSIARAYASLRFAPVRRAASAAALLG